MPTYLTDVRNLVEKDLTDTTNVRWTDAEIDQAVYHALQEYSRFLPQQLTASWTATAGQRVYDLATVAASVLAYRGRDIYEIEQPYDETDLPDRNLIPFNVVGNTLYLLGPEDPAATDTIKTFYRGNHTLTETVRTYNPDDEQMIVFGGTVYAIDARAQSTVNVVDIGGPWTPAEFQREARRRREIWERWLGQRRGASGAGASPTYRDSAGRVIE